MTAPATAPTRVRARRRRGRRWRPATHRVRSRPSGTKEPADQRPKHGDDEARRQTQRQRNEQDSTISACAGYRAVHDRAGAGHRLKHLDDHDDTAGQRGARPEREVRAGPASHIIRVGPTTSSWRCCVDATATVRARIENSGEVGFLKQHGDPHLKGSACSTRSPPAQPRIRAAPTSRDPAGHRSPRSPAPPATARGEVTRRRVTTLDLVGVVARRRAPTPRDAVLRPSRPRAPRPPERQRRFVAERHASTGCDLMAAVRWLLMRGPAGDGHDHPVHQVLPLLRLPGTVSLTSSASPWWRWAWLPARPGRRGPARSQPAPRPAVPGRRGLSAVVCVVISPSSPPRSRPRPLPLATVRANRAPRPPRGLSLWPWWAGS